MPRGGRPYAGPVTDPAEAPAPHAARVLLQALAALGVRHVVLAPGSRSAPLAHALASIGLPAASGPTPPPAPAPPAPSTSAPAAPSAPGVAPDPHAPDLTLHVRIDERAAAFLALGLARAHGAPAAVVTTSGTAAGNLLPAVLEADAAHVPLLLLTADRPHELRGTGANQTTAQVGLLEPAVRLTIDVPAPTGRPGEDRDTRHVASRAVAAALGARTGDAGPVHVNLAYRDPLAPATTAWPAPAAAGLTTVVPPAVVAPAGVPGFAPGAPATVVIAGDGAGRAARDLAEANGWPLLAEPSSGARGGPHAIPAYRTLLGEPHLGGRVRGAVVLGRPTLSRPVQALLARDDVAVLVVGAGAGWPDAARGATAVVAAVPADLAAGSPADPLWLGAWRRAGAAAAGAVSEVLDREGLTGPAVAAAVARATGAGQVLVVGSSNPVRDLDLVAAWDEPPRVVANRGLAGIDGTLGTAAGLALGLGRPVRALVGDLTFLHDAGSLLIGPLEARPDLQVVVVDDGGGSIFATLEHGEERYAGGFERVFATPVGADVAALCRAYGAGYTAVGTAAELAAALAGPGSGVRVVHVRVDRSRRRHLTRDLADAAVAAARSAR